MKEALAIFLTVFLAELGDKTQLATLLFATERQLSPLLVFLCAAGALVLSTGIAVAAGTAAQHHLALIPLKLIAGLGFIAIGGWTLYQHFTAG
jgi:putative Ca2+/H+ antiporter (TMEM165/GDT1 family)